MEKHRLRVKRIRDREFAAVYGGCFRAVCSCGWESAPRSRRERAETESARHRVETEGA